MKLKLMMYLLFRIQCSMCIAERANYM